MGYHLNIFKGLFHLPEILAVMEDFFNIIVSNLFTVTDSGNKIQPVPENPADKIITAKKNKSNKTKLHCIKIIWGDPAYPGLLFFIAVLQWQSTRSPPPPAPNPEQTGKMNITKATPKPSGLSAPLCPKEITGFTERQNILYYTWFLREFFKFPVPVFKVFPAQN